MTVISRIITEIIVVDDAQFAEVLDCWMIELKSRKQTNPENKRAKQTRRENGLTIHI